MTLSQSLLSSAKAAGQEQAIKILNQMKTDLIDTFKSFINKPDLDDIEFFFVKAVLAKTRQFAAQTDGEAQEWVEVYENCLQSLETIGEKYELVAKAKAGKLLRNWAHSLISGAFAVGGAVLQAGLTAAFGPLGSLIGAGANAGIQHVVSYFLERSEKS